MAVAIKMRATRSGLAKFPSPLRGEVGFLERCGEGMNQVHGFQAPSPSPSPENGGAGSDAARTAVRGFTLLEVILALAILGLALATLGQAVGRSHESARRAADETELTLIASSVLEEILAQARPLQAIDREAIADPRDPSSPPVALVSALVENGPLEGLLVLRVEARPNDPMAGPLETVTLTRWLVDPSLESSSSGSGSATGGTP